MKINKFIVFIISIIFIIGITFSSYATDIDNPDVGGGTNSETTVDNNDNNNNNNNQNTNDNNNNQNNNDENNTTNENEQNNNQGQNQTQNENNNQNDGQTQNEPPTDSQNNNSQTDNPIENNNNNEPTQTVNSKPTVTYNNNSYTSSANTQTRQLSDNANLKSLTIDVEGLTPDFNKNVIDYYLVVGLEVESINVEAVVDDNNATYYVEGNEEIKEGQNTIKVVVTAENGETKTYKINVTKTDNVELTNANLKTLVINRWGMYPNFKPNIFNYSLTITDKISKLDIQVETENEEATFEIEGNENLTEGDNLIKIIVTAQDGETIREYKINAFISSEVVKTKQESKLPAFILLAILGVGILVTITFIKKRK